MDLTPARIEDLGIKLDSFIAVLSSRNTGKSFLIGQLIQVLMKQGIDYIYMFSNTAKVNRQTNENYAFIDTKALLPTDPETITNVIHGLMTSQKKTEMKYKILIILDDIVLSSRYESVERLASMGRHFGITCILSAQIATKAVSPTIRSNISYLFFRKLPKEVVKDNIYPIMSPTMMEFEELNPLWEFIKENTHDHQFLFFDNNRDSDGEDRLRVVKAHAIDPKYKYVLHNKDAEARLKQDRKNRKIMNAVGTSVGVWSSSQQGFRPDPSLFGNWKAYE